MKFPREIFYDIDDERIIEAIDKIPREVFVSSRLKNLAYEDSALPIGFGQTISQPSLAAYMTGLLDLKGDEEVLEIGTGSGYQTALLARLSHRVYTIEIIEELHRQAKRTLDGLGIDNVVYKLGNGYDGWKEYAPFDRILVTAAPPSIPKELIRQLKENGKMVVPVGREGSTQVLKLIVRSGTDFIEKDTHYVRFVPMVEERKDNNEDHSFFGGRF